MPVITEFPQGRPGPGAAAASGAKRRLTAQTQPAAALAAVGAAALAAVGAAPRRARLPMNRTTSAASRALIHIASPDEVAEVITLRRTPAPLSPGAVPGFSRRRRRVTCGRIHVRPI